VADRYKWDYQDAVVLRDHTLEVHDGLNDTLDKLDALINDMKSDPDWGGEHRDALMAWMDLLRQFHAQLMTDLEALQVRADAMPKQVDEFYEGAAKPRLQTFYGSYAADVQKLWFFESVGEQFIWQIIDDFGKADEDLMAVLVALAEGN